MIQVGFQYNNNNKGVIQMKSEAIRLVTDLVERANNQAETIDSRKLNT